MEILLYTWAFVAESWGGLASIMGALLTVMYSRAAKKSSEQAKEASEQTRQKLVSVDSLTELGRLLGRVDDLLNRLENQAWLIVVERATELRVSIAAIIQSNEGTFSEEVEKRLSEAVTQFKNISSGADKVIQSDAKVPDVARYRRIVADQKETLILASQEIKAQVGELT